MNRRNTACLCGFLLLLGLLAVACNRAEMAANTPKEKAMPTVSFKLTSPAFKDGEAIPPRFTGDGEDVSPALQWTDVPAGTKSFALVADDPDAPRGTWVHWVAYCIPGDRKELKEAVPKQPRTPDGILQGKNDFGKVGYNGPAPPPGKPHRYFFRLYALDFELTAEPGLAKQALLKAIEGHVLGEGQLMGTYHR
jgi:Raf kinase inhibitor-like YbhB/YbcL family protein